MRTLFDFVLKENVFTFGNKTYKQIQGTAMGTKMAPSYANTFMNKIEQDFLEKQPIQPLVWKRYIDDIFAIWTDTRQTLDTFIQELNQHHPTLNYTHEISSTSIDFLDVTIHKGNQFTRTSHLDVKTFFKKTNTFQYLHYKSAHPPSTHKAVIIEATRFKRTNTNKEDYDHTITQLNQHLSDRDYPHQLIEDTLKRVTFDQTTANPNPRPNQTNHPLLFTAIKVNQRHPHEELAPHHKLGPSTNIPPRTPTIISRSKNTSEHISQSETTR